MLKDLWEKIKAMPTWQKVLLLLGLVAVVGIALYVRSQQSAAAASASTPTTTGSSGLLNGTDVYGNPLQGDQTPTTTGGTPTGGTSGGGTSGGGTPTTGGTTIMGTIRAKGTDPSWDKNNAGVPERPGASTSGQVGLIPFGSQVTVTGSPVSGTSNGGSSLWYPVTYNGQAGFLSAFDLSGFSALPAPTAVA